jgi:hypothetical protein
MTTNTEHCTRAVATGWDSMRRHDRPMSKIRVLLAVLIAMYLGFLFVARATVEETPAQIGTETAA